MTDPRLIDDVAREMTSGDPAAGFRVRVMARVAAETTEPRLRWRTPLWLAAAGAAVVVVAGLVVLREPQRTAEPAAVIAAAGDAPPVSGTASEPGTADDAVGQQTQGATRRVQAARLPASVLEWRARVIPELTAVAPLAFAEIQPVWLSITQLDVTPLGILPITLPPIGDGGGRW